MNDPHADMHRYFDGELSEPAAERFADHLVACASCQRELNALLYLELASARALKARPASWIAALGAAFRALRERPRIPTLAGLSVAVAILLVTPRVDELTLVSSSRAWELRLPSQPHQPYRPLPGGAGPQVGPDLPRAAGGPFRGGAAASPGAEQGAALPLHAPPWRGWKGDRAGIALAYLLHDQLEEAAEWLERAPPSADALATRSALALRQGRPHEAMRAAQQALQLQALHPSALWNRAVALKELHLDLAAAQAYEAVAALGEPGWADEARAAAERLRRQGMARQERFQGLVDRCRAATEGTGTYPLELIGVSERWARLCFHDVLRTAGTAKALEALEPVAATLDARFGGDALSRAVAAARAGAGAARQDISRAYAGAISRVYPGALAPRPTADEWLGLATAARAAGQPDLELGALYFVPPGRLFLPRYVDLARSRQDPWFTALAEEKAAAVESWSGQPERAVERLRYFAGDRCGPDASSPVTDRCLTVERAIARYHVRLQLFQEANRWSERALERARADGDLEQELDILLELGQVVRLRADLGMTHAYLEEALAILEAISAMGPRYCDVTEQARSNLAIAHQRVMDFAEVRHQLDRLDQIDQLEGCGDRTPSLARMFAIADMQRIAPRPGDEAVLRRGAEAAAGTGTRSWSAADRALLTHILGRARLEHDGLAGERLLRQAIFDAERLSGTDRASDKARFHSYTSLLLEAGKRGAFDSALQLFTEERGAASPRQCALWLTSDDERLLTIAVDRRGTVLGHYQGARARPIATDEALVPADLLDALRPCPAVEVIARAPLEGRPNLLPPDIAWSHVVRRGERPLAGNGPRVVVASPALPSWLSELPPLTVPPPSPGVVWLDGAGATPGQVLKAARGASLLELHVHGFVSPELEDASFLALAEESSPGNFALTAAEVRKATLAGHPLVLLAACHSARMVPDLLESHGLPEAFVEAGARAVLAVPGRIPDAESEPFFRPLMERIQSGVAPAVALRDARSAWRQARGRSWVDSVLLFE